MWPWRKASSDYDFKKSSREQKRQTFFQEFSQPLSKYFYLIKFLTKYLFTGCFRRQSVLSWRKLFLYVFQICRGLKFSLRKKLSLLYLKIFRHFFRDFSAFSVVQQDSKCSFLHDEESFNFLFNEKNRDET